MSIFAVLGIQFFAGKFGRCATDASLTTKAACEAAPHGLWQSQPHMGSFDNIFSASLLLFEISSLEGWPRVMYMGIDAVGVDVAGEVDANPIMSIYIIQWVFLGGFVVLNVFVGVLIDTFAVMEMRDTLAASSRPTGSSTGSRRSRRRPSSSPSAATASPTARPAGRRSTASSRRTPSRSSSCASSS